MLEHLLHESVLLLGAAVVVLFLCSRLRVPPIVGLLLTGLLIGPSGLALVAEPEEVEAFAEIGVMLLLFVIGLEFSLERLRELQRAFFIGGAVQALSTTVITVLVALGFGLPLKNAVFLGFAVTLSSTAIVLKLYAERRETPTPHGKVTLGILLFQDFLIVPMIVLTPVLGGEVPASPVELAVRFGGAVVLVGALVWGARRLLPSLLDRAVATRVREIFVLGALVLCLGMAWLTHSLGFSLALGAFVAGILVAETDYSHQVIADISPLRDVFASLFFISMGMLVDLAFAADHLAAVLSLAAAIIVGKILTVFLAVRVLGYPPRIAILVALGLAQIGEFSFVLMEVGASHGLLVGGRFQLILAAAVLTMIMTPVLHKLAPVAAAAWTRWRPGDSRGDEESPAAELDKHVVIVGFGVNGRLLARVLREVRIAYVVIELNGETVRRARREGEPMLYGDATQREILEHAGVERATAVVFATFDPESVRSGVRLARALNPSAEIVARTRMVQEIEGLREAGADHVIAEEFETAIEVFTRVLERYHVPRHVVRAQTRVLRGENYRMLRSPSLTGGVSEAVLHALTVGTTDLFRVDSESPAAGQTLRQLELRRATGASVIALVRGDISHPNPSADLTIEPGDCLVLVGSHSEIDRAFDVLARDGKEGELDVPAESRRTNAPSEPTRDPAGV